MVYDTLVSPRAAEEGAAPRRAQTSDRYQRLMGLPSNVYPSRCPPRGCGDRVTPGGAGNGKGEGCTWSSVPMPPDATLMALDDGTADGQPDAHPGALRRVERIEDIGEIVLT